MSDLREANTEHLTAAESVLTDVLSILFFQRFRASINRVPQIASKLLSTVPTVRQKSRTTDPGYRFQIAKEGPSGLRIGRLTNAVNGEVEFATHASGLRDLSGAGMLVAGNFGFSFAFQSSANVSIEVQR